MCTIFDTKVIQILCHCQRFLPLCRTYFCRYCYQIRCANCITHEVDCYYCPTCLETMASGEANSRKDKCTNCFDCPSCGNMLSLRASVQQVPKLDDNTKVDLQKFYYMACNYCRWTTRESDIPDRKTSTNCWPQYENPYNKQIKALIESFNQFATKEKLEKERSKYASRKNYFFLMDTGSGGNRRRISTQMRLNKRYSEVEKAPTEVPKMESKENFDDIDESIFENKYILEKVSNIEQRLRDPERQPQSVKDFRPISKQILVKRSMRCRKCDHNLSKPEIATNSIRFKINLGSVYHIPELKIRPLSKSESFEFNKAQKIVLTLVNPAHRVTTVKLGPVTDYTDKISTAKLSLPSIEIRIGAKNEIMGFDEIDNIANEFDGEDDTNIIAARKANKVELYATVIPMKSKGAIISCLQMTFDYKDATQFLTNANSDGVGNVNDLSFRTVTYKLVFGHLSNVSESGDTVQ